MDAEAYDNMVLRPDFSHLKDHISEENLLVEWGGKFSFDIRSYIDWRAQEEGVVIDESNVRRYDPKASQSASQGESMIEAMLQVSVMDHANLSLKKGLLKKQGNGQGFFSTYKWKEKLVILVPGVLLYFDSTEENEKNFPSKVIPLGSGGCYIELTGKGSDGVDEKLAISLVTPERNYTFAALNEREKDEWVECIRSAIADAASPHLSQSSEPPPR
jgi:hypothetical protein